MAFVLAILAISAHATTRSGTIERVVDGDTIVFLITGAKTQRVRLADIDTPELDQPWGLEAKAVLKVWLRIAGPKFGSSTRIGTAD